MYQADEIIRFMNNLMHSPEWEILTKRLDFEVGALNSEISRCLMKKEYDRASHLNGKKEMVEFIKALPSKIKRSNQGIIERVREMILNGS